MNISLIVTLIFFVVLFGIAAWGMTKTKNVNDFFLGGKTLGPWILSLSYGTAYFSAVIFIGFAGQVGWFRSFDALWVGIMNALFGGLLAWLVLGRRTRNMTRRLNVMTMPEFFCVRYRSNTMKVFSAIIIFCFLLPYSASVFAGLSYLFQNAFNIDFFMMLTIITVVTGYYVVFGGYQAAARIDFLLGIIMLIGSVLMIWFLLRSPKLDAGQTMTQIVQRANELYQMRTDPSNASPDKFIDVHRIPNLIFWSVVFMTSLAPWGLPQMVHKYYAIKDENQIIRGAVITFVFALVIGFAAYFTGALSHLLPLEELQSARTPTGIDTNALVPIMLVKLLPPLMLAVILLLVLSASMSTLSSLILVSSSAISLDLYKGFLAPNKSEKNYLWTMRILSFIFIVVSYVITVCNPSWIVALMSLSWGAVAGSFLSPYIYGLFWRRTTKAGAFAGMLSGLLIANGIYWGLFVFVSPATAKAYAPVAASLAMTVPFLIVPIVSLMTSKLDSETVKLAFGDGISEAENEAGNCNEAQNPINKVK